MSNYFDEKTSFMEPIVTQYGYRMVLILNTFSALMDVFLFKVQLMLLNPIQDLMEFSK